VTRETWGPTERRLADEAERTQTNHNVTA